MNGVNEDFIKSLNLSYHGTNILLAIAFSVAYHIFF